MYPFAVKELPGLVKYKRVSSLGCIYSTSVIILGAAYTKAMGNAF